MARSTIYPFPTSRTVSRLTTRASALILLPILMVCHHYGLWALAIERLQIDWTTMFNHWDSSWYTRIVTDGYRDRHWAFFPLYPALLAGLKQILSWPVPLLGVLVSTLFLGAFCLCMRQLTGNPSPQEQTTVHLLAPSTGWGWFCFIYGPASFIFHSHHTESLFVLLSFGALYACARGYWWQAALLAGLCSLTRNQGILLAVAIGLANAHQMTAVPEGRWRSGILRFVGSGLVSGAVFSLFPLYQFLQTGQPLMFLDVQFSWNSVNSIWEYLRTFWFGNPWQNTNTGSLLHHGWYLLLLGLTMAVWRHSFLVGCYCFLSLAIIPMQGELINSFRFGGVLFPLLFYLGDRLVSRWPTIGQWLFVLFLLYVNHMVTRNFALARWAY